MFYLVLLFTQMKIKDYNNLSIINLSHLLNKKDSKYFLVPALKV